MVLAAAIAICLPRARTPSASQDFWSIADLIVWLTPEGRIRELDRNQSLADADTRLEVGDIILKSDQYRFLPDGTIHGGILAQDAVIDGKPKKSGDPVVIPAPSP